MSPIKHVVISAAGIGSRLGLNKPKCLVEIAGRTLLDYHLERLSWAENIWLVVGFEETEVIRHAMSLRNDLIIVRNPDYARTNTLQSIHLVSRHLQERFLVIDADTVVEPASFNAFMVAASECTQLIGISRYTTSDGVRVLLDETAACVTAFTRAPEHAWEWTGIAVIDPAVVVDKPIYVYQALEGSLPMRAAEIKAFDIDTIADLDMARQVLADGWPDRDNYA